jgi:hypothetical protein
MKRREVVAILCGLIVVLFLLWSAGQQRNDALHEDAMWGQVLREGIELDRMSKQGSLSADKLNDRGRLVLAIVRREKKLEDVTVRERVLLGVPAALVFYRLRVSGRYLLGDQDGELVPRPTRGDFAGASMFGALFAVAVWSAWPVFVAMTYIRYPGRRQ